MNFESAIVPYLLGSDNRLDTEHYRLEDIRAFVPRRMVNNRVLVIIARHSQSLDLPLPWQ